MRSAHKSDKMSSKSKIEIEIDPETEVDVNNIRDKLHSFMKSMKKEYKSIRIWVTNKKSSKNDTK